MQYKVSKGLGLTNIQVVSSVVVSQVQGLLFKGATGLYKPVSGAGANF